VVLRPGPLTDDPGTGRVRIGTEPFRDAVTRDDVAAVLAAICATTTLDGTILYLANGEVPIDKALATLAHDHL
jgi:hypothetical protein